MRNLITILSLLALTSQGWAGNTDTRNLQAHSLEGVIGVRNLVQDPGFEDVGRGWTASGGATAAANSTAKGTGSYGYDWDSNSASQTLTSAAVTIPAGLYGKNAVVSCAIKCASGTCTHTLEAFDGTNPVSVQTAITNSSSMFARTSVNFVMPSSGTIAARLTAVASNEGEAYVDDCRISAAEEYNLSQVNQVQLIASGYFAGFSNCDSLTRTNTALGALTDDTDCGGATVESNVGPGTLQTTDYDNVKFAINSMPPGRYEITMWGSSSIATGAATVNWAINDGTTTSPPTGVTQGISASTGIHGFSVTSTFVYTTTANRTFQLYGASSANALKAELNATSKPIYFTVKRYPSTSELAYRPDQSPAVWSGYHASADCSFSRNNTAVGDFGTDASCTFTERDNVNFGTVTSALSGGNKLPGITFTPPALGRYKVCASFSYTATTGNGGAAFVLTDGTTRLKSVTTTASTADTRALELCGLYNVTSIASTTIKLQTSITANTVNIATTGVNGEAVEWVVTQETPNKNVPILVGSVTSESTGAERIEWARVASCSSSPCTVSDQSGGLTSVTRSATGCYSLNFPAGRFSATPACSIVSSTREVTESGTPSATAWTFCTKGSTGTDTDSSFYAICAGHR